MSRLHRRHLLTLAVASLAVPVALGQSWLARPIYLVVPFPQGGLIDNMARLMVPWLSGEPGQAVVIDNKPGVCGNQGVGEVARAAADGDTSPMASPPLTIGPVLLADRLPCKPEQIERVALLGRVPNVLVVNPASGIIRVADLRGSLKVGRLFGRRFATHREAMDEVIDWLTFYNHRRLHCTLGYISPMKFEAN